MERKTDGQKNVKGPMRQAAVHLCAVIKGILFTGFTIQILLGTGWMFCHFLQTQDFTEPDSALYRGVFRLVGENCQIMYLLQLVLAFYAGYRFPAMLCSGGRRRRFGKLYAVWGSLAVLTFPFAMQCHLAVQPYSFMGSLFLLMLSFFAEMIMGTQHFPEGKSGGKQKAGFLAGAILCGALMTAMSGVTDRQDGEPGHSLAAAMASRMAWPDVCEDFEFWPEELQEITGDIIWDVSCSADNMEMLWSAVENSVGRDEAKRYYREMAETGWNCHAREVIHRIAWDILGYTMTPLVFRRQLEGTLFDSYTGRNYEVMRAHMPVFTKHYVEYGCWWFGCCLFLAAGLMLLKIPAGEMRWKKRIVLSAGICILAAGVVVFLFTMRGAGRMDYKCTIAVNELWLIWAVLLSGEGGSSFGDGAGSACCGQTGAR